MRIQFLKVTFKNFLRITARSKPNFCHCKQIQFSETDNLIYRTSNCKIFLINVTPLKIIFIFHSKCFIGKKRLYISTFFK